MFARSQHTHLFRNFHVSNRAGKCSASNARSWMLRGISGRAALNVVGRPKDHGRRDRASVLRRITPHGRDSLSFASSHHSSRSCVDLRGPNFFRIISQ
jgi:hypothetical protein